MVGIYAFKNKINNFMYVGQSKNIAKRKATHFRYAFNPNAHEYGSLLHRAIRKYGVENFQFLVIEQCEVAKLNERERYWIKFYDSITPRGYNILEGGYASVGWKLSKSDVEEIMSLLKNTSVPNKTIAERYRISENLVCSINTGKSWKTDIDYPIRKGNRNDLRLSQLKVDEIINLLKSTNHSMNTIALMYGVKEHCISAINRGRTHRSSEISYPIRNSKYANKRYYKS